MAEQQASQAALGAFALNDLPDQFDATTKGDLEKLLRNGLFYLSIGNPTGALAAFASAATVIHTYQRFFPQMAANLKVKNVLQLTLGYIEGLQKYSKAGGAAAGAKKDEDESSKDWDKVCEKISDEDPGCLTFGDVIGMKEEKEKLLTNLVRPIVYPNLFTKAAKGVLLYGPPGTGKTYLMKAAVRQLNIEYPNEVQVLFFNLTGADLKGKFVGETEKRIVEAYTCAALKGCQAQDVYNLNLPNKRLEEIKKQYLKQRQLIDDKGALTNIEVVDPSNPKKKSVSEVGAKAIKEFPQYVSIIFIDEFDSIGQDRNRDETGLAASSVNTLLQVMDGFRSFKNVITVAATNFPWNLDAALLRRFNEHIYVKTPKAEDIRGLIKKQIKDRIAIERKTKREYCLTDVKKFKESEQMGDLYSKSIADEKAKQDEKKKDPCKKDDDLEFPLNIIDRKYATQMTPEIISVVYKMEEEHYSNSDVDSVMQKAFNKIAEACLEGMVGPVLSGMVEGKEERYQFSRFTKFQITDGTPADLKDKINKIPALFKTLSQEAANEKDTLEIPKGLYMDLKTLKSPFDEPDPNEKRITAINYSVNGVEQIYISYRFINDLPPNLLFHDSKILDIFYNKDDVNKINQMISQKKTNKDHEMNVIFTRKIDFSPKMGNQDFNSWDMLYTSIYDGISEVVQVKTIKGQTGQPDTIQKTVNKDRANKLIENINIFHEKCDGDIFIDFLGELNDYAEGVVDDNDFIALLDEISEEITNPTNPLVPKNLISYTDEEKRAAIRAGLNEILLNIEEIQFLRTDDKTKRTQFNEQIDRILSRNNYYRFLPKYAYFELENMKKKTESIFEELKNYIQRKIILIYLSYSESEISEFGGTKGSTKIIFFKARFKPFNPMWIWARAGTSYSIFDDNLGKVVNYLKQKYYGAQLIEEDLQKALGKLNTTASEYLLFRTNEIGVLDGKNDQTLFTDKKKAYDDFMKLSVNEDIQNTQEEKELTDTFKHDNYVYEVATGGEYNQISELTTIQDTKTVPLRGIYNIQKYCVMNAVVQLFYGLDEFLKNISGVDDDDDGRLKNMRDIFERIVTSTETPVYIPNIQSKTRTKENLEANCDALRLTQPLSPLDYMKRLLLNPANEFFNDNALTPLLFDISKKISGCTDVTLNKTNELIASELVLEPNLEGESIQAILTNYLSEQDYPCEGQGKSKNIITKINNYLILHIDRLATSKKNKKPIQINKKLTIKIGEAPAQGQQEEKNLVFHSGIAHTGTDVKDGKYLFFQNIKNYSSNNNQETLVAFMDERIDPIDVITGKEFIDFSYSLSNNSDEQPFLRFNSKQDTVTLVYKLVGTPVFNRKQIMKLPQQTKERKSNTRIVQTTYFLTQEKSNLEAELKNLQTQLTTLEKESTSLNLLAEIIKTASGQLLKQKRREFKDLADKYGIGYNSTSQGEQFVSNVKPKITNKFKELIPAKEKEIKEKQAEINKKQAEIVALEQVALEQVAPTVVVQEEAEAEADAEAQAATTQEAAPATQSLAGRSRSSTGASSGSDPRPSSPSTGPTSPGSSQSSSSSPPSPQLLPQQQTAAASSSSGATGTGLGIRRTPTAQSDASTSSGASPLPTAAAASSSRASLGQQQQQTAAASSSSGAASGSAGVGSRQPGKKGGTRKNRRKNNATRKMDFEGGGGAGSPNKRIYKPVARTNTTPQKTEEEMINIKWFKVTERSGTEIWTKNSGPLTTTIVTTIVGALGGTWFYGIGPLTSALAAQASAAGGAITSGLSSISGALGTFSLTKWLWDTFISSNTDSPPTTQGNQTVTTGNQTVTPTVPVANQTLASQGGQYIQKGGLRVGAWAIGLATSAIGAVLAFIGGIPLLIVGGVVIGIGGIAMATIDGKYEGKDVYIINQINQMMFSDDTIFTEINSPDLFNNFPLIYKTVYPDVLKKRKAHTIFGQADDFGELTELPAVTSKVILKKITLKEEEIPKANMLNFYIDHSFINSALNEYRSTWDTNTGNMLQEYYDNRDLFLQKWTAGEYEKKK